jgi:glycosyltransferase involved in cell wall biosynthesis
VLIIVQNLPVPLDRRVWLECQALRASGIGVSVICPKGSGDPWHQRLDGVELYKYPPPPQASGLIGYAWEFAYCWVLTALLSVVVAVRDGFGAIQACNPPDTFWALALLWRPFGKRFVYDQHDLNPEVFLSRFGPPRDGRSRAELAALRWLERSTYRAADEVISTNESYRRVAVSRGRRDPATVTVVRSGPDTSVMRPIEPPPGIRADGQYLAVYLGIMGPQDGVDLALRAFAEVVHTHGRKDCQFALLGFGDCLAELKRLSTELELDDYVTFTGRVDLGRIADYLSAAHLGICPDPSSPLNDVSTMNKVMEYMAYCLPMVSFDLPETRFSAEEAAVYVASGDIAGFARAWIDLLDNPDQRVRRGLFARERVVAQLDWQQQAEAYRGVWQRVLGIGTDELSRPARPTPPSTDRDPFGRRYIQLSNPAKLAAFVAERTVTV